MFVCELIALEAASLRKCQELAETQYTNHNRQGITEICGFHENMARVMLKAFSLQKVFAVIC